MEPIFVLKVGMLALSGIVYICGVRIYLNFTTTEFVRWDSTEPLGALFKNREPTVQEAWKSLIWPLWLFLGGLQDFVALVSVLWVDLVRFIALLGGKK